MNKRNIPVGEPSFNGSELRLITECVKSGWVSSIGKFIGEFEKKFAKFCGSKYAVSTPNGTAALHLALYTLGIGSGDEVIIPSFTFIATANAVMYTGAKPVFIDVTADYWNIDPDLIEKSITPKTKAIIAVHIYGHPADMDKIMKIAEKHKLYVIEDAAEAHGAKYRGKKVGSIGTVGCFSFYGNKIITTGEGGMITTDSFKLADRMRFLKDHAMSTERKYYHPEIGYNYRMTNLQAALGVAQLSKVNKFLIKKIKIAKWYKKALTGVPGIILPPEMPWATNIYWMYSILLDGKSSINRDELMHKLKEKGIDSRPFFYPIHKMPPYRTNKILPVTNYLSENGLNLPSSVNLTKTEVNFICKCICGIL